MEQKGFPWKYSFVKREVSYKKGICPTAEMLNKKKLILLELCVHEYSNKDVMLVIDCFKKVWKNLDNLKKIQLIFFHTMIEKGFFPFFFIE